MNADKPIGVARSKGDVLDDDSDERSYVDGHHLQRPAMPNNPEMTLFWKHLSTALADINTGDKTSKEALDQAAAADPRVAHRRPRGPSSEGRAQIEGGGGSVAEQALDDAAHPSTTPPRPTPSDLRAGGDAQRQRSR